MESAKVLIWHDIVSRGLYLFGKLLIRAIGHVGYSSLILYRLDACCGQAGMSSHGQ